MTWEGEKRTEKLKQEERSSLHEETCEMFLMTMTGGLLTIQCSYS